MVQDRAILAMVYRTAPFSVTLIRNADFKVTPLFDAERLRNGTRYIHVVTVEY